MYISKESHSVKCHCDTGLVHVRMKNVQCVSPLSDDAQPMFSYCFFIYCNFNLLPTPEAYTTVQSLIIPI